MKAGVFGFLKNTLGHPISMLGEENLQFNGSLREENQFQCTNLNVCLERVPRMSQKVCLPISQNRRHLHA